MNIIILERINLFLIHLVFWLHISFSDIFLKVKEMFIHLLDNLFLSSILGNI